MQPISPQRRTTRIKTHNHGQNDIIKPTKIEGVEQEKEKHKEITLEELVQLRKSQYRRKNSMVQKRPDAIQKFGGRKKDKKKSSAQVSPNSQASKNSPKYKDFITQKMFEEKNSLNLLDSLKKITEKPGPETTETKKGLDFIGEELNE